MSRTERIRYGERSQLELEFQSDALIAICGRPRGTSLDDPEAAVGASCIDPLDFPALVEATVPGDRVVLAVNRGVPQMAAVVAGVVQTLVGGRVAAADICVVLAPGMEGCDDVRSKLPSHIARAIQVCPHQPRQANELAYLATSREGNPIMVNRRIVDADVVIPIGCHRAEACGGVSQGNNWGVFPAFSDEATHRRFQSTSAWTGTMQMQRRQEMDEVMWLLGASFTIQIIPGAGDEILHILSGALDSVLEKGARLARAAWEFEVPRRAGLVIAAIEGGADQQTWENVARALYAASQIAEDQGAIAVCCEVMERPGAAPPNRDHGIGDDSIDDFETFGEDSDSDDAVTGIDLGEAIRRHRVYLLSQLDEDDVERLGMAYVGRPAEIGNLCRRHTDCIVIANAQHTFPLVGKERISVERG